MTGHTARVGMCFIFFAKRTDYNRYKGTLAWNEHVLSSGSRDRSILHRDVRCQEHHIKRLLGHKQEVCGLKWNTEQQLASGGNDNRLLVWDKMNETPTFKFNEHTAAVKAISWSPHQVRQSSNS
jgi:cell division cycle 20-like protein 1 (cofactor of APC complex)